MVEKTSATPDQEQPVAQEKAQPEQIRVRREKLGAMREQGNAYPNTWRNQNSLKDIHDKYDDYDADLLQQKAVEVTVAGRLMAHRVMGKSSFVKIQDRDGEIQLFLNRDNLGGAEVYDPTKKWDLGDLIGAKGVLFVTKTGELSIKVSHIEMITKCLRPLPEKWHGLSDIDTRYRQRYVDLMVTPESRNPSVCALKLFLFFVKNWKQKVLWKWKPLCFKHKQVAQQQDLSLPITTP